MTNMFLTSEDLEYLTGYKVPACQIKWLENNGIKFWSTQDGKPRVLTLHLHEIINKHTHHKRRAEPNFEAIMNI